MHNTIIMSSVQNGRCIDRDECGIWSSTCPCCLSDRRDVHSKMNPAVPEVHHNVVLVIHMSVFFLHNSRNRKTYAGWHDYDLTVVVA